MKGSVQEETKGTGKKPTEISPTEGPEDSKGSSKNSSKINSPRDTEDTETSSSKLDSNLIVRTSENGKIEDIISPVAITQKKPFQEESSETSKDANTEERTTMTVETKEGGDSLVKEPLKSISTTSTTTSNDPISSKLSQSSLKRRKIPPPLGITPTSKKSKQSASNVSISTATNSTTQQGNKVSRPQVLQRPRVQYLGKINQTRQYSQTATTPSFHNRIRYGSITAVPSQYHLPPQQQQQQIAPIGFTQPFPGSGAQTGMPPHPMSGIPPPFPTSTTPYMTPSYYYPYGRMPPNPAMIPQTAATAGTAYYPYVNNPSMVATMPDYLYRDNSVQYDGSDFSIKRQMSKSPTTQDSKEDEDENEEENGDDIEGSDLAIEDGAVPTPVFTRFPQGVSSDNMKHGSINESNSNGLMFGEIRIQDNRYSFEFPQKESKELNKKIFMSICNQIWNECGK